MEASCVEALLSVKCNKFSLWKRNSAWWLGQGKLGGSVEKQPDGSVLSATADILVVLC